MTNNMRDSFEAWYKDYCVNPVDCGHGKEAWIVWQAATDKLRNAVIILPDDAEPEVGDIIVYQASVNNKWNPVTEVISINYDLTWFESALFMGYIEGLKIIQRQGKPVIYESEIV